MSLLSSVNRINPLKYFYIGKLGGIVYRIKAYDAFTAYDDLIRAKGSNLDCRLLNHVYNCSTPDQAIKFEEQLTDLEIID